MSAPGTFNTIEQFRSPEGGILLVDKPLDWTSFDVIRKLRGVLRVKKMGHAGTLDPLATGLLILASGKRTKDIDAYQAQRKVYEGAMTFGAVTPSYDAATEVTERRPLDGITPDAVRAVLEGFIGVQAQVPPMYSALKKDGRRLYQLARAGVDVQREARAIEIHALDVLGVDLPVARFRVECSKGTYVRSLAHDAGARLGCGAYLCELRRVAIGEYAVNDAWTLDGLAHAVADHREEMAHAGV